MTKILQIVPHYLPAEGFGGVVRAVSGFSAALVKSGANVRIATTNLDRPGGHGRCAPSAWSRVDGLEVLYNEVVFPGYWGFSPQMVIRLPDLVKWADIVLLHFHYQFSSVIGGLFSRFYKKKYIIFTHGSLTNSSLKKRRFLKKSYLKILEYSNFKQAEFLAFNSLEEMENSEVSGIPRVIPNGVSRSFLESVVGRGAWRSKMGVSLADPLVLFIGRLNQGKGLVELLPAFAEFRESAGNAVLVIAGSEDGLSADSVRQLANEEGIGDAVRVVGFVSGEEKMELLADADVFVLPSKSEGMSMAMLEAMAAGLPVLTTDCVGLWRTLREKDCGVVVPLNIEALVEGLKELSDPERRLAVGKRGRDLVASQYTWDAIAASFLEMVRN